MLRPMPFLALRDGRPRRPTALQVGRPGRTIAADLGLLHRAPRQLRGLGGQSRTRDARRDQGGERLSRPQPEDAVPPVRLEC